MADSGYIKGGTGILYWLVTAPSTYKPIACLTSNSMAYAVEMLEKVNMCNAGVPTKTAGDVTATLNIEGEVVISTTDVKSLTDLETLFEAKAEVNFKLMRGERVLTFKGLITDLSDSFTAGEDATFSATIQVNGDVTSA